jgi:SAM-dependent methyltransferase
MTSSYKLHFVEEADAIRYDQEEYGEGSYSQLLWALEKSALKTLVQEFHKTHPEIRYLDFASGTGRVAEFMENAVASATAIEVSPSMAARARSRLRKTEVLCRDITEPDSFLEARYDLITCFRFFLNTEPEIRLAAMQALAARLLDEQSWLIFNNHGNLASLKILGWPYHRLRGLGAGGKPYGNYLKHSEVKSLLQRSGLRVVRILGLGVLGGKICGFLPFDRALRLERRLAALPLLRKIGQDQIYVVCRASYNPSAVVNSRKAAGS